MRILPTFLSIALCGTLAFNSESATAQTRTSPVNMGEVAPDFTLVSHLGDKITLSEARLKSPVVLVFYRGYW